LIAGLDPARPARVRAVAAELLGQLGALSATPSLARTLGVDPDLPTRTAAARSLGRLGLPEAVPPLLAALQVREPLGLRIAAANSLGRVGGHAAIGALGDVLGTSDTELARAAADGLAASGVPGLTALERAAADPGSGPAAREALARVALGNARRVAAAA
jgi:HEAT repeat protein